MVDSLFYDTAFVSRSNSTFFEQVDLLRLNANRKLKENHKAAMGQFLTPMPIARFMAAMLQHHTSQVHILDAGAGIGTLFAACVAELCHRQHKPTHIQVTAYEIDKSLAEYLSETLLLCKAECQKAGIQFSGEIIHADFIKSAVDHLRGGLFSTVTETAYTCAILNPPYRKINTDSTRYPQLTRETPTHPACFSLFLNNFCLLLSIQRIGEVFACLRIPARNPPHKTIVYLCLCFFLCKEMGRNYDREGTRNFLPPLD